MNNPRNTLSRVIAGKVSKNQLSTKPENHFCGVIFEEPKGVFTIDDPDYAGRTFTEAELDAELKAKGIENVIIVS